MCESSVNKNIYNYLLLKNESYKINIDNILDIILYIN